MINAGDAVHFFVSKFPEMQVTPTQCGWVPFCVKPLVKPFLINKSVFSSKSIGIKYKYKFIDDMKGNLSKFSITTTQVLWEKCQENKQKKHF